MGAYTFVGGSLNFAYFFVGWGPNQNWDYRKKDALNFVAHELAHATPDGHGKAWRTTVNFLLNGLAEKYEVNIPCEHCVGIGNCDKSFCPKCIWEYETKGGVCNCDEVKHLIANPKTQGIWNGKADSKP